MYQFTNYTFKTESADEKFHALAVSLLNGGDMQDGIIRNEEDTHNFTPALLYNAAEAIFAGCPGEAFSISGYCDASAGSGEYMYFEIVCDGKTLSGKCSDWYTEEHREMYDSYEEFSEEHDGEPPITEEEFEQWGEEPYYVLSGGKWVREVDLENDLEEFFFGRKRRSAEFWAKTAVRKTGAEKN